MEEVRLTFGDHLDELRSRVIMSLLAIVVTFLFSIFFLGKYVVTLAGDPLVHALEVRRETARAREVSLDFDGLSAELKGFGPGTYDALLAPMEEARRERLSLDEFSAEVQQDQTLSQEAKEAVAVSVARLHARDLSSSELLAEIEALESLPVQVTELLRKLVRVSKPPPFIITSPTEAFITYMKICLVTALFISSPFIIYQVWQFVASGLYPNERRYVTIFGPVSGALFIAGSSFFYFLVSRYGLVFLFKVGPWEMIDPRMKIDEYITFFLAMSLVMGGMFQLPLVIVFLAKVGIVEAQEMARQRRLAYLISFILAALLTPPDVVTQLFLAFPMIILFEAGLYVAKRWT